MPGAAVTRSGIGSVLARRRNRPNPGDFPPIPHFFGEHIGLRRKVSHLKCENGRKNARRAPNWNYQGFVPRECRMTHQCPAQSEKPQMQIEVEKHLVVIAPVWKSLLVSKKRQSVI
jgi:hypothetical protein